MELYSVLIEYEFVIIVWFGNFSFVTLMRTTQWAILIFGKTVGSFDVHEKKSDIFINTVNVCNDKTTVKFAKKR